jgi:hypothetical protein
MFNNIIFQTAKLLTHQSSLRFFYVRINWEIQVKYLGVIDDSNLTYSSIPVNQCVQLTRHSDGSTISYHNRRQH